MRVIYEKIRHARYLYIKRNVKKFGVRVIYRKIRYCTNCLYKSTTPLQLVRVSTLSDLKATLSTCVVSHKLIVAVFGTRVVPRLRHLTVMAVSDFLQLGWRYIEEQTVLQNSETRSG